jgi:uncharacterized membrane protein (DUF373 family)
LNEKRADSSRSGGLRDLIARQFTRVEDVVYVALGLLLTGCAATLLVASGAQFVTHLGSGTLPDRVIDILDRILLVLLIVEVLYTVQVSFREHALLPEPFLIVGLIAVTRRILVLTAEVKKMLETGDAAFRNGMLELGILAFLIVALVVSLVLLRRRPQGSPSAHRAID